MTQSDPPLDPPDETRVRVYSRHVQFSLRAMLLLTAVCAATAGLLRLFGAEVEMALFAVAFLGLGWFLAALFASVQGTAAAVFHTDDLQEAAACRDQFCRHGLAALVNDGSVPRLPAPSVRACEVVVPLNHAQRAAALLADWWRWREMAPNLTHLDRCPRCHKSWAHHGVFRCRECGLVFCSACQQNERPPAGSTWVDGAAAATEVRECPGCAAPITVGHAVSVIGAAGDQP